VVAVENNDASARIIEEDGTSRGLFSGLQRCGTGVTVGRQWLVGGARGGNKVRDLMVEMMEEIEKHGGS